MSQKLIPGAAIKCAAPCLATRVVSRAGLRLKAIAHLGINAVGIVEAAEEAQGRAIKYIDP